MLVRKYISMSNGQANWYIIVNCPMMKGYHCGEAQSIAEAEQQIDDFLDRLKGN